MRISDEVPDLYRLAFVPGVFRCPQCNFQLTKSVLNFATGQIGTTEKERQNEPCPNDGTEMVHVTYREVCEEYGARIREELATNESLREELKIAWEAGNKENDEKNALGLKLEDARATNKALVEALTDLVKVHEESTDAMLKAIGRPDGWTDSYLDKARAALDAARGGR